MRKRTRISIIAIVACFILTGLLFGCSNLGYYLHMANGHLDMLSKTRPINEVINDPTTPDKLKQKLELILEIRQFGMNDLQLPQSDSYLDYADLERPYVVWNVVATPELSLEPRQSCFIIVGCMNYRGFFDEQSAREWAKPLQERGDDVYISEAAAYSTLGWFDDPVLNTMVNWSDAWLAGIIFHELTHQKIYLDDDTTFNESLAMTIQHEGVRRWLQSQNQSDAFELYQQRYERREQFLELIASTAEMLDMLYQSGKDDETKRREKLAVFDQLRQNYNTLKTKWNGYSGYDSWFEKEINNARLALISTYHELIPGFQRLLEQCSGDLGCFYHKVEQLSRLTKAERHAQLKEI